MRDIAFSSISHEQTQSNQVCCFQTFPKDPVQIILEWKSNIDNNAFIICFNLFCTIIKFAYYHMDRVKRIWYLSPMRAAKVQASLRIRAVSPEPPLLNHTSSESRGTFRQKARSLASLNGWACAVKTCRDGMLEDTNSLDGAHMQLAEIVKTGCAHVSLMTGYP